MNATRGFVTVATGDYYCYLAENLVMSYKLFSKTEYPMYVMTDKKGEARLKKCFDGIIVLEKPHYTFMDKMTVYQNSPFDETIFLDADMNIISDISYLFDDFEQNGSSVSCIGSVRTIEEWGDPIHFGKASVDRFSLDRFIAFGGGMYYYKRCAKTDRFFDFITSELIPNYGRYELKRFRVNQMADEPLMGLSMMVNGMKPLDSEKDIMKFHVRMMDSFKWDLSDRKCSFVWWENRIVSPAIAHYGTHNTYTRKYVYYNALVRCRYHKVPAAFVPFYVIWSETVLFFRHLSRESDRRAFRGWFVSHFRKEHFRYRKQQIKSLLKK